MDLEYSIFKAADGKIEENKNQNYFDFNPHLNFLIQRDNIGDKELAYDILKMVGELSAQHLAPKADANDKEGCKLQWQVGDYVLSHLDFQKFNEIKDSENYNPEIPVDVVGQAVNAFRSENNIPIFSEVVLPEGAKEQIKLLREQDLIGISVPEKYGGSALSHMVNGATLLSFSQADGSLLLRVMLTEGVADLIENFATDELKDKYLPGLCSDDPENNYIGAMLITESNAGSDLRGITVKALKKDGKYLIGGRKIFITNPDADVSIVLARMDGAPFGTLEGLTLFLVPKYFVDEKGNTRRNQVHIENLEEKLGIHASPTGSVFFKGAEAYLIGQEGEGLKQMLYLMNKSRLGIGIQGLGIAERAYLESAIFCTERKQFGKIIAELPLMQEILATMRIEIEATTSLIFKAYNYIDRYLALRKKNNAGEINEEEQTQLKKFEKLIRILTPLAKYHGSRLGVWAADMAVSNFGGYGYINEFKVERLIRDAKIATIYEGTNNMMVLDVQRSIANERTLEFLIEDIQFFLDEVRDDVFIPYKERMQECIQHIYDSQEKILKSENPDVAKQVEARKFAELLINVYQAGLMLEEAQYLIDHEGDWRKAVMAMKFIDDKISPASITITGKMLSVKFFENIFYCHKLESL